jgi:hypothetical protein
MGQRDNELRALRLGRAVLVTLAALLLLGGLGYLVWGRKAARSARSPEPEASAARPVGAKSRYSAFERFGFSLGEVPRVLRSRSLDTGSYSNIEPEDYSGVEKCQHCHADKYQAWSQHSHRWMNAAATPDRVVGDFRDRERFRYLGGEGRFWRDGEQFRMAAERGPLRREFRITRTIGSRYFLYYVGVQTAGPEPAGDPRYQVEHVLPFGYWLTKKQWVPTVHIREERADDFDDPALNPYEDFYFRSYDDICARCHTTLALGDWLIRYAPDAGHFSPYRFSLDLTGYLKRQRPGFLPEPLEHVPTEKLAERVEDLMANKPPARIVRLGIECEACHNGGKEHVADPEHVRPHFFPTSPLLYAELPQDNPHGRTHANVNWICARCHIGYRPQFPGGMSTWNSTEYSDAMRGGCYSRLKCIDCHEPHRAIGPVWARSPDQDDKSCLRCHEHYREPKARREHTHHAPGSEGDRCMNCHMPRINEGLDTVVRTHTIFSPTKAISVEKNGPNACNLCHLDRPIDWTLGYLRDWYGKHYSEYEIAHHYPYRREAVGVGWLRHPFRATRLVAAAAYGRRKSPDILPELLGILNDPYLLNRQFGQLAVEALCGQSLEQWNYRFTQSPEERAAVLPKVRAALTAEKRQEGHKVTR